MIRMRIIFYYNTKRLIYPYRSICAMSRFNTHDILIKRGTGGSERFLAHLAIFSLLLLAVPLSISGSGGPEAGELQLAGERQLVSDENVVIFEKQGFTYLHVEGAPYEIGYNHGKYLAAKVARSMSAYGHLTVDRYGFTWAQCRVQSLNFWYYVPQEQKDEIRGIADGAADQGVRNPDGTTVDWLDILVLNAMWDLWWRAGAASDILPGPLGESDAEIETEPRERSGLPPELENIHHCSAFVATGSATADGNFVIGQTLWMPFYLSPAHAVFIDIVPNRGLRILMEVTAGMIWSGTEWYMNSAGMVIGETTLGRGPYNWGNIPSFIRLREAAQYAESIDDFKDIMLTDTNGAYCGDYLLADAKTNEVAILELGANVWELARTKDGFLGSCNYPWDPEVAEEMNAIQGWEHGCYPRYVRLEQLYEEHDGNITVELGMEMLSDHYDTVAEEINPCGHTLCGHVENESGYPWGSLDGKLTNRTLAERFETWARFGHTCGQPFIVSDHREEHPEYSFDDLVDIIPGDWCTFGPLEQVTVSVLRENGEPVEGAKVEMISLVDGWSVNGTTDPSGVARLPAVMHSRYEIVATSGQFVGKDTGIVREETHFTVTVSLPPESGITILKGYGMYVALVAVVILGSGAAIIILKRRRK